MRKDYSLFLCESTYTTKDKKSFFIEKPVCELGSSSSTFSGQAFDVEFYTKIDGTHELSFKLPRYYYDEFTGERVKNELVELVVNKSHIELTKKNRKGKEKTFYLVVNNRKDKEEKGVFSYEYSCTDVYIEELSKNGYSVFFDDEVEGNGLGDIHHFAKVVAEKSGWNYAVQANDKLPEYKIDEKYDPLQMRMNEVRTVVPVFPVEYIPELKRYCYATDLYKVYRFSGDSNKYGHRIYCYDDSKTITTSAAKNLLHNGDDFVDTIGWNTCQDVTNDKSPGAITENLTPIIGNEKVKVDGKEIYSMTLSADSAAFLLMNDTCADANKIIQADKPYIFYFKGSKNIKITNIRIYGKNPFTNKVSPDYMNRLEGEDVYSSETCYVIKTKTAISNPYFTFTVTVDKNSEGERKGFIHKILFFEAIAKGNEGTSDKDVEDTKKRQLKILETFTNGKALTDSEDDLITFPDESTFKAFTEHKVQHFYREHQVYKLNITATPSVGELRERDVEEKITYLNIDEDIVKNFTESYSSPNNGEIWSPYYKKITVVSEKNNKMLNFEPTVESLMSALGRVNDDYPETKVVYKNDKDGKYYEYYETDDFSNKGYLKGRTVDYAFLGDGKNEKRRTYKVSKSNFFNIIQDLAELFKVWPVFELIKNHETNEVIRQFYFREGAIKDNFSGFHRGVNLVDITRTMDSNDVVTKIFVEDQENDLADEGFVTIRTAALNPWGENYYYNFGYYIDQKLLNVVDNGTPLVEKDKDELYQEVGRRNRDIRDLNEENIELKMQLSDLEAREVSLTMQIATAQERVASMTADLNEEIWTLNEDGLYDITYKVASKTDRDNLDRAIGNHNETITKKTEELSKVKTDIQAIQEKHKENNDKITTFQKEKEKLINAFEELYRPFIKEGVWFDNSYIDNNTYYLDSLKVMQNSSRPKLEWSISVIDGSIATELENFEFEVGDKTLLVDNEFFGIEKNERENYTFEVLIAGIKEGLDNAVKNTIEVRNYLTSFEDLFQRVAAATQTLELNEQTYNKSEYFTADGKLSADLLQKTLDQNKFILANASDNSFKLDHTGLSFHAVDNPTKQLRIIAEGMFVSNSRNLQTGEPLWRTGITADGISADLITAGTIDTANIRIYSGSQPLQIWNAIGISSYSRNKDGSANTSNFIRLDQFGLYVINLDNVTSTDNTFELNEAGKPWFYNYSEEKAIREIETKATCAITKNGFTWSLYKEKANTGSIKLGYLEEGEDPAYGLLIKSDGKNIVRLANDGKNQIAGWLITNSLFYFPHKDGKYGTGLGSTGGDTSPAFWAGYSGSGTNPWNDAEGENWRDYTRFYVQNDGTLFARGADIDGILSTTSSKGATITLSSRYWTNDTQQKEYPSILFTDPESTKYGTHISADWNESAGRYEYSIGFHNVSTGKGKASKIFSVQGQGIIWYPIINFLLDQDKSNHYIYGPRFIRRWLDDEKTTFDSINLFVKWHDQDGDDGKKNPSTWTLRFGDGTVLVSNKKGIYEKPTFKGIHLCYSSDSTTGISLNTNSSGELLVGSDGKKAVLVNSDGVMSYANAAMLWLRKNGTSGISNGIFIWFDSQGYLRAGTGNGATDKYIHLHATS